MMIVGRYMKVVVEEIDIRSIQKDVGIKKLFSPLLWLMRQI